MALSSGYTFITVRRIIVHDSCCFSLLNASKEVGGDNLIGCKDTIIRVIKEVKKVKEVKESDFFYVFVSFLYFCTCL